MKTPYAILIGLALIAAALFFRQPSIPPAQAGILGDDGGRIHCTYNFDREPSCVVFQGDHMFHVKREWDGYSSRWETDKIKWR
jgi:hypothetical protein